MKAKALLLVVIMAVGFAEMAYTHHSSAATYFGDRTARIEGKLVGFQFRNPHSWVQVEAPDEKGVMRRWGVEWDGVGQLASQGVSASSLKVGDVVVIVGNPGRDPKEYQMKMVTLHRNSDGFQWGKLPGEGAPSY